MFAYTVIHSTEDAISTTLHLILSCLEDKDAYDSALPQTRSLDETNVVVLIKNKDEATDKMEVELFIP